MRHIQWPEFRQWPEYRVAVALAAILYAAPGASLANDSTGFLGTTGIIELTKTDAIAMLSERLEIGQDRIRVDYVFKNVSAAPVETTVAFPLPDIDLSSGPTASNFDFPARGDNFLGFSVSIDGKPVAASLERRALFKNRDVTKDIEAIGLLSMVPWNTLAYTEQVKAVPPDRLDRLRQQGLIAEGEDSETSPQWILRSKYYWKQTFPAGREVKVHHEYKPFTGRALIGKAAEVDGKSYVGRYLGTGKGVADRYCIDSATRNALIKAEKAVREPAMAFSVSEIEYILTTANNWRGPIGTFTLILDKGAPGNILSLCFDGSFKKTGPTTFEATLAGFAPTRDINLLIFVKNTQNP